MKSCSKMALNSGKHTNIVTIMILASKNFPDVVDSRNRTLCVYCGSHQLIEKEHVLPKSRGGETTVPACRKCNRSKSNKAPMEWFMFLKCSSRPSDQERWSRIVQYHRYKRNKFSPLVRNIREQTS